MRESADVVQHDGQVGVRWAEPGDEERVCLAIQGGGLVEAAYALEHDSEVVAHVGGGEIVGAQAPLGDGQSPSVGPLGAS